MFPYMVETKGLGNYVTAFEYAQTAVNKKDPMEIVKNSGVRYDDKESTFCFESLGMDISVSLPECAVTFAGTDKVPILEWRLAMLHYLGVADGAVLSDELSHFRQMRGGYAYESAFKKRSTDILAGRICDKPVGNIEKVLEALGGKRVDGIADAQAEFMVMPRFPVVVQIWLSDDDMEGTANILFNKMSEHYMPTEDMAVVASFLSRFIVKRYDIMFKREV